MLRRVRFGGEWEDGGGRKVGLLDLEGLGEGFGGLGSG